MTFSICNEKISESIETARTCLVENDVTVQNGIWPRSLLLWMAVFYMALFIIRPWEQLFPSLAFFHLERTYAIFLIMSVFLSRGNKFHMAWQPVTVLFFLAASLISGFFAYDSSLASDPLFKYATLIIFYFILLLVICTPYDLVFTVLCYIVIMCVYLGKAQWEYIIHGRHVYRMGVSRLVGIENTFGGPNDLAMSIVVSLPFALLLWRNHQFISETWPAVWKRRLRRGLMVYGVLAALSIILTNSRSGMAGGVVFITLLMLSGKGIGKKIRYLIGGTLVLAIIWLVMPEENKGRFRTIWKPEEGPANAQVSAQGRVEGFKAGMEMFRRYPMTGVGIGNYRTYRVQYLDGVPLEPHNFVGQLLGETGLIGGITFLLFVGAILGNCRNITVIGKNHSDVIILFFMDMAKACFHSLILLIFLGMFGHTLYRFQWLWIGAFALLALRFTRERLRVLEQESDFNCMV